VSDEIIRDKILHRIGEMLGNVPGMRSVTNEVFPQHGEPVRPCIQYLFGAERSDEDTFDAIEKHLELIVDILGSTTGNVQPDAHRIMADVVKALAEDDSVGGLVHRIKETSNNIYIGEINKPEYIARLTFDVWYAHGRGDWTKSKTVGG
jgi:hypothetical protein